MPMLTDGSSEFVLLGNRVGTYTTCNHDAVDHNPVRGYVGVLQHDPGIPFGVPRDLRFPFGDPRRLCETFQNWPSVRMPTESRSRFSLKLHDTTHNITLGRWGLFDLFSIISIDPTNLTAAWCNFSHAVRGIAQAPSSISAGYMSYRSLPGNSLYDAFDKSSF